MRTSRAPLRSCQPSGDCGDRRQTEARRAGPVVGREFLPDLLQIQLPGDARWWITQPPDADPRFRLRDDEAVQVVDVIEIGPEGRDRGASAVRGYEVGPIEPARAQRPDAPVDVGEAKPRPRQRSWQGE